MEYEGVTGRHEFMLVEGNSCFDNSARVAKAGAGIVQDVGSSARYSKIGYALPIYLDQSSVVVEIIA